MCLFCCGEKTADEVVIRWKGVEDKGHKNKNTDRPINPTHLCKPDSLSTTFVLFSVTSPDSFPLHLQSFLCSLFCCCWCCCCCHLVLFVCFCLSPT